MESLLIDAADVTNHSSDEGGWTLGREIADRSTGVTVRLRNVCADPEDNLLVDGSNGADTYKTRPVLVDSLFAANLACFDDDTESWLNGVLKAATDLALGRALVSEPMTGYGEDGVWIGHEDVDSFSFSGNPYTSGPALALAIARARVRWSKKVVGENPVLHMSPTLAPVLFGAGVVHREDEQVVTIWGDRVVMSPGYDSDDPNDVTPTIFWSGPIKIDLGAVENTKLQSNSRQNQGVMAASLIAVIDVSPHSIVRIDVTA